MVDWHDTLAAPLAAAEHGVEASSDLFGSVHDGPLTFDRIDYPAAQVYLDTVESADATNWQQTISTVLYFEWDRQSTTREDILHPVAGVLEETLAAFDGVDCITNYHPNRIDFFSGEPQNSLVLAVAIQFRVRSLIDPGTFDEG